MIVIEDTNPLILHSDSTLEIRNKIVELSHKLYENNKKEVIYIEVGIYYGGTFKHILKECKDIKIKGIGIDLFEDFDNINKDKENTHSNAAVPSLKGVKYALKRLGFNNFKLLKGDSVEMLNTLRRKKNVICYIDGNHTYKAVKNDFYAALEKIRKGYIILDDINIGHNNYGTNKFYEEIKNNYSITFKNNRNVIFEINEKINN